MNQILPPLPAKRPFPAVWRAAIIGTSLFLYALACCLPSAHVNRGYDWNGAEMLLEGWLGLFLFQFAWLANLLYFPSLVFIGLGWWRVALYVTIAQTFISLDMLSFPGTELMMDEGGSNYALVLNLLPGAWLWLVALMIPGIGFIVAWYSKPKS